MAAAGGTAFRMDLFRLARPRRGAGGAARPVAGTEKVGSIPRLVARRRQVQDGSGLDIAYILVPLLLSSQCCPYKQALPRPRARCLAAHSTVMYLLSGHCNSFQPRAIQATPVLYKTCLFIYLPAQRARIQLGWSPAETSTHSKDSSPLENIVDN